MCLCMYVHVPTCMYIHCCCSNTWNNSGQQKIQWTPSNQLGPLKCGHPCILATLNSPKVCFMVQIHPWNEATPVIRTLWLVPRVAGLEGVHCTTFILISKASFRGWSTTCLHWIDKQQLTQAYAQDFVLLLFFVNYNHPPPPSPPWSLRFTILLCEW